jgi:hypothetical protein
MLMAARAITQRVGLQWDTDMTIYYSAVERGFYDSDLKEQYKSGNGWPSDAIEITEEDHQRLIRGQELGKVITADSDGKPILTDPVINWQAKAEIQRQSLLTSANTMTTDWRTELELDIISNDDKASLVRWMGYIKALKILNLSSVNEESGYEAIKWPVKP